jgi:O-6-methylguanine DNA methyltransferase
MKIYFSTMESPIGPLALGSSEKGLVFLQFAPGEMDRLVRIIEGKFPGSEVIEGRNEILREASRELKGYLKGEVKDFRVPLNLVGTPFQKTTWQALSRIPYGDTRTYGQISQQMGVPKASRAVGSACGQNPVAIIVPCHRVVGRDGRLVGYACGVERKRWLLDLEKRSQ